MGFKEGFSQGQRTAEKIYNLSSEFESVHDPKLDARLLQAGITKETIQKLRIWPTNDPEEIGWTAAALWFTVTHGTIWNSDDMHPNFRI